MGNRGAASFGVEKAETPVDESVEGVVKIVDGATREKTSGKLWMYTGELSPW